VLQARRLDPSQSATRLLQQNRPTPDVADMQTREYWRGADHHWQLTSASARLLGTHPPAKNLGVAS
jgi:hypothetical protein